MTPGQLEDAGGLLNRSFSGNCPPNPLASVLENSVSSQAWMGLGLLEAGEQRAALCIPRAEYLIQAMRPESPRGRPPTWAFRVSANPQPLPGHSSGGSNVWPEQQGSGSQDTGFLGKAALSTLDVSAHPLPEGALGPDWLACAHLQPQGPMDGHPGRWRAHLALPGAAEWCHTSRHKDS